MTPQTRPSPGLLLAALLGKTGLSIMFQDVAAGGAGFTLHAASAIIRASYQ